MINSGKEIVNDIFYGSIKGTKADEDGKPLAGAIFALFKGDTEEFYSENALMTAVSKEDGSFSFAKVPCGEYLVVETQAPKGYARTDFAQKVVITRDSTETVVLEPVYNKKVTGSIIIKKLGEPMPEKEKEKGAEELIPLAGAKFGVYKDDELIPDDPHTGDSSNVAALGLIAAGAASLAIGVAVCGRKRKEETEETE